MVQGLFCSITDRATSDDWNLVSSRLGLAATDQETLFKIGLGHVRLKVRQKERRFTRVL